MRSPLYGAESNKKQGGEVEKKKERKEDRLKIDSIAKVIKVFLVSPLFLHFLLFLSSLLVRAMKCKLE